MLRLRFSGHLAPLLAFAVAALAASRAARRSARCRLRRRSFSCPLRRWCSAWRRRWSTSMPATWSRTSNPFMADPFFRQFFGGGGMPREQVERSLGSGVIVDPSGLVVTNYHVIEGASEVKVALADKREFDADIVLKDQRSDLAVLRIKGAQRALSDARIRQFRRAAGRRRGAGDRRSVRRRPDRDPRHRLGGGAHPGRHQRLSVLHPDRRRHQSRQFRRRAGRYQRPAGRHQLGDLFALRRLAGHRLCHPGQHGAGRGRLGARAAAARSSGRGSAPSCRKSRRRSPRASG